jgi:hypothetical protein
MVFAVKGITVLLASYLPLLPRLYVQLVTTVPLDHTYHCDVNLEIIRMLLGCHHALVVPLVSIVIASTLPCSNHSFVLKAFSVLKIPSMNHNILVQLVVLIIKEVLQNSLIAKPALKVTTAPYRDYHFQLIFVLLATSAE